jgi:hypothetical protein
VTSTSKLSITVIELAREEQVRMNVACSSCSFVPGRPAAGGFYGSGRRAALGPGRLTRQVKGK